MLTSDVRFSLGNAPKLQTFLIILTNDWLLTDEFDSITKKTSHNRNSSISYTFKVFVLPPRFVKRII